MPHQPGLTGVRAALVPESLDQLRQELTGLRAEMLDHERGSAALARVAASHRASARNLLHYLILRRHDVRGLQTRLAQAGLSSLGRSEPHVMVTLDRVLGMLALARGKTLVEPAESPPVGFREGEQILSANTLRLLGPARPHRSVRIMVTMPAEAAADPALVRELLASGMDCARINCAHDGESEWGAMVENIERARHDLAQSCSIIMDLAGPKLRTKALPHGDEFIRLGAGDHLALVSTASTNPAEGLNGMPAMACEVPEIFRAVRVGESVWLDDGKFEGVIERVEPDRFIVRIEQPRARSRKLRAGKGINLPDSTLDLGALTAKDLGDLPFVCAQADALGLSFVQREADVHELQEAMRSLGGERLGLLLKIETRAGFANLPKLIMAGMGSAAVGVMIARGDLAVECGFKRLAEVQEEILWVAEAGHAPTVWATQVLESLAKKGVVTRAEVTDAAMSGRAEAVMLNKGPYLVEAIRTLDDILSRMQTHQAKKRSLLRPLHISDGL